jgi:hypothetical protein
MAIIALSPHFAVHKLFLWRQHLLIIKNILTPVFTPGYQQQQSF